MNPEPTKNYVNYQALSHWLGMIQTSEFYRQAEPEYPIKGECWRKKKDEIFIYDGTEWLPLFINEKTSNLILERDYNE